MRFDKTKACWLFKEFSRVFFNENTNYILKLL